MLMTAKLRSSTHRLHGVLKGLWNWSKCKCKRVESPPYIFTFLIPWGFVVVSISHDLLKKNQYFFGFIKRAQFMSVATDNYIWDCFVRILPSWFSGLGWCLLCAICPSNLCFLLSKRLINFFRREKKNRELWERMTKSSSNLHKTIWRSTNCSRKAK